MNLKSIEDPYFSPVKYAGFSGGSFPCRMNKAVHWEQQAVSIMLLKPQR